MRKDMWVDEYERRLDAEARREACTVRSSLIIGGVIIVGVILLLMFTAPYMPGSGTSGGGSTEPSPYNYSTDG